MLKRALLIVLHYMNLDVCELIFTVFLRMQNTGAVQNVYYAKLKDISYKHCFKPSLTKKHLCTVGLSNN